MRNCLFLILWILSLVSANAQMVSENGFPFIRNYTASNYRAHPQNFAVLTDSSGITWVGNFAGVLQYDGELWRLIPTKNTTRVSALSFGKNQQVLVGGRGEFGLLSQDAKADLQFVSISGEEVRSDFLDIKAIFPVGQEIWWISDDVVFKSDYQSITEEWKSPEKILSAFEVRNELYFQLEKSGLHIFRNKELIPVPGGAVFSNAILIASILPLDGADLFIATTTQGIYRSTGHSFIRILSEADQIIQNNTLTCALDLGADLIALGSSRKGILVISPEGKVHSLIDKEASLQNSFVRALHRINQNTIWAALNNGIAMIGIPSQLTYFDKNSGLEGSVNQVYRFKNDLYAATYQGLFLYQPSRFVFEPVEGIISSCWALQELDGDLLAATSQGIYRISNHKAILIKEGFILSLTGSNLSKSTLYCGETGGFARLIHSKGQFTYEKFKGVDEEIHQLISDDKGNVWGATLMRGIFRFNPATNQIRYYQLEDGLPEMAGLTIHLVKNQIMLSSRKGLFSFADQSDRFEITQLLETDTATKEWYSFIYEAPDTSLWVNDGDETNIRRLLSNSNVYQSDQNDFMPIRSRVIKTVFSEKNGVTWLGGPDGLFRYNPAYLNEIVRLKEPIIRNIIIGSDSMVYAGNDRSVSAWLAKEKFVLDWSLNSISIAFASPFHHPTGKVEYQFYLQGYEDSWGEWTTQPEKEYTNLSSGNYQFKVRSRNVYGVVSESNVFEFSVLPPWYTTWWAILLYLLVAAVLIYAIVVARNRKLLNEKKQLEEKIAERTAEVVQQKEEIENQSMELANKNDELEKINSAIKSINAEVNFENLLQSLLEKMKIIRAAEKSIALVYDRTLSAFWFKAAYGWNIEEFEHIRLSLNQAENRYLKDAQEVFEDVFVKNDFSSMEQDDGLGAFIRPKSMLILVIRIENQVDAFILFENFTRENAFETKDISLIKNSKEHIISAIIRARILENLQSTLNDLKDTQTQLVQSEKLASLAQLTAGIAHEIQNPLNFVNNFSALTVDLADELNEIIEDVREKLSDAQIEDLEEVVSLIKGNVMKINDHGKRVETIVKGMLQHSRGSTGEFEQVEFNPLIEEFVNLAYHGMKAKSKSFQTSIRTELDPSIQKVSIVPQDLSRVILNIVNNSCYALDEKLQRNPAFNPEVVVTTRKVKDKIEIRIRDNGTGIPQNVIDKIFNPFFTTKPTGQGTGLGLSMSFDIINKIHKGKMEVFSEEGEYTEFILSIPEKQ